MLQREIKPQSREQERHFFLLTKGLQDTKVNFLAGDCSPRTYYRVETNPSQVLMDAPPTLEDVRPFLSIRRLLQDMNYSVPHLNSGDVEKGFLLLEDLGDSTFTNVLNATNKTELYGLAIDLLIDLHQRYRDNTYNVPLLTFKDYKRELEVFMDWYYPYVHGNTCPDKDQKIFYDLFYDILEELPPCAPGLVLRDFHVDNLVYLQDRVGIEKCGLLDFQDARFGPTPYDVVSLLEDARVDVPTHLQMAMKARYLDAFPGISVGDFNTVYNVLGAQRSIKILGIFVRMKEKYNKPQYLSHIPRVWKWIQQDLKDPLLTPLKEWMDLHFPKERRQ